MQLCRCVLDVHRFLSVTLFVAFPCCCADTPVAAYTPDSQLVKSLRGKAIERQQWILRRLVANACSLRRFTTSLGIKTIPKFRTQ